MKIHKTLSVDFGIQNFGTAWLGILRGPTEQIELAFNGFYNYRATEGKLEYQDGCQTIATFWTSKKKMRRYFINRYYIPAFDVDNRKSAAKTAWEARRWAIEQMSLLSNSQEAFINYNKQIEPDTYSCGIISAEKPDLSLKEYLVLESFKTSPQEKRFAFKKPNPPYDLI